MSAIAKDPRQNQPGKPTLVSFKQKGKKGRNWTAGVIASAIAVAWAVGGLVMPSLAATPSAQASVKPTVNVSPDANFNMGTNGNVRYRLAYTGQLFSTKDPQEAAAHYGDTAQVGDFTAHYLPKECITKADRFDTMGDMKGTPRWDGYDALEQVAPDRGKIAQKPLGQNAPMGFGAWVIFPGSSSATLPFNPSGSASRAATSDRSAAEPEEEDADTLTLSLEPIEGEATETGATQARIFGKTADPAGDSGTSTEPSGAGNAPQLPANPEEPSSAPELSPESPAPAAVGEDRAANPTPTKTIFSGAVPFGYKFEPTMKEIKLKFDPSVDKDTAIANFNKQVDEAQADVMNQLEQFVNGKPFDARTKKAMVDNLNLQFDNLRKQGLAWFEEQYSKHPSASKFPGIKACEDNGPIVPVGSFILVKNWTAATKGEHNVWQWARKHRNEGQAYHAAIDFLALYPSDTKNSFKVDGQASFCVEPFYGYQIGNHKVYTDPSKSTIYWAKDNPEKAETVKALAWHFAKNNRGANWGHYQNAIWMVIFGITDNGRAWNLDQMSWGDTGVTDVKNLIQEARTAYQHRQDGNVVKALETMHLDQVSLQPANDGGSLLTVQLNDYNPNSTEGRIIGDQVYLTVQGATYADGKPIPNNQISLREALNGVTLKIANQNAFKISFAGSVKNVEDPYFIDNPNGPTQAQVVVLRKDLDLSGSLEVKWTYVPQPKPAISTTAKVNGAESVPGGAETATFSRADEVITLTDDVKYENIPADTASNRKYLIGTLTKVSEGIAKKVFTQVADAKISGEGTVTGLFPYEVKASEVKKGDRFYYEEILATSDPKYAGGETVFANGYGRLNVIAKHTGENPDQTVLIAKNKAELTLSKEAIGAADKADGNVTFRVSCDDGTAATLYAPARGGVANTNPAWAGYQASSIEVTPGAICTVEETYSPAPVDLATAPRWVGGNAEMVSDPTPVNVNGKTIGSKAKFKMGDAGDINLAVTNTYREPTGGFKVFKYVNSDGKFDAYTAANANGGKFNFYYRCDKGIAGSFALPEDPSTDADGDPWSYEVKDLPIGARCSVTEMKPTAPSGYDVTISAADALVKPVQSNTVALRPIRADFANQVSFMNQYLPADASFSLRKIARFTDGQLINDNFALHYSCSDRSGKTVSGDVTVAGNGEAVSVKGVKAGMTCTITEPRKPAIAKANFKDLSFDLSGTQYNVSNSERLEFDVPRNPNAVVLVTATNVYEQKAGSFTLQKTVKAGESNPLKGTAFTFRISCGEEDPFTVSLKAGQTWTSKSYPVGTECLIHEYDPSTQAATSTVSYQGAVPMGTTDAVLTVKEGKAAVKVEAVNTVKANYGKFALTKKVEGDAKAAATTFAFDYKCNDAAHTNGTLEVRGGQTKTVGDNILVGTTCYIKEKPVQIDGVTVTPSWVTNLPNGTGAYASYKQFTIPQPQNGKAQVLQLEAKNTLEYDKASFTIKKVIQGGAVFTPDATFKFTYSCKAPDGKTYTQATPFGSQAKAKFIEVAAGQESAAIVVPQGSKCSVSEPQAQLYVTNQKLVNNPNANPLKYVSTSFVPEGKGLTSGEQTVTDSQTFQFAATNVYTEKMTGFKFYKAAVTGNNAGNHTEQFYFNYSCQTPAGEVKNGVGYDLGAGSDPVTVENLPVGTKCVVWEKPAVAQANEKVTTKWTVGTAEPVEGKDVKPFDNNARTQANGVAFTVDQENQALMVGATNDFTVPDTKLVVSKTIVAGENTTVGNKSVKLSATCKYPTDNAEHVIMDGKTFKNGDSAEFTTDVNGVKIPVGATCTISESESSAKVAGHLWTVQMKEGKRVLSDKATATVTLDAEKGRTVEVINTYERELGKFKITKSVSAAKNITVKESYSFSYTCADPQDATQKVAGKVTGVTDKGYKVVDGIPLGYKCHITEDQAGAKTEEGSTLSATLSANDFVVGKDNVVDVSVTNTYSKANGKFSVKKAIAQDSTAAIADGTYNFEYWCVTPDGSEVGTAAAPNKFSIKAGQTWTSGNIATGSKCAIREVTPSGTTTGVAAEVSWSLQESTTMQGVEPTPYQAVGAENNFVFGAEGSTAGKFTIGKNGTTTGLTATNKLSYEEVKLKLQKIAEATSAHGRTDYSQTNFENMKQYGAYYRYMNRDYVNMHVTCKNGAKTVVDKTVQVNVNGDALDFGMVPYNSKCTVAELDDESFNDWNAMQYGGWRHKAVITATDASGKALASEVNYAFDMMSSDGEQAAITFDVTSEADVSVLMRNRWDCFASIESVLDAPDHEAVADGKRVLKNGIKVINVDSETGRIKLTDTVTLKNVTANRTYTVVERLYSTSKAGDRNRFDQGYLTWESENGETWDYYAEEVTVPGGANDFTTDISFTIPVELLKKHPEGIAAGIMVFNGGNPMNKSQACARCLAYGSELKLPAGQSIVPQWAPTMSTIAYDRTTDSRVLSTNEKEVPTQKLTDNLTYTKVPAGDYYLYGRLVQTDDTSKSVVDNAKKITVPAGQNFFGKNRVDNEFNLQTSQLTPGAEYVMFEYMLPANVDVNSLAGKTPAELQDMSKAVNLPFHAEVKDICQKLYTPKLKTNAAIDKPVTPATTGTVKVKDKVDYFNLVAGKQYTLTGTLHVKAADGSDAGVLNDPGATKTETFTVPGEAGTLVSGSHTLTFTVKAASLKTQTVVAFEEVKDRGVVVATHAEITDEDQTVYNPSIGTTASVKDGVSDAADTRAATVDMTKAELVKDSKTKKELSGVVVTDKVAYNSIAPGEYVMYGQLMTVGANGKLLSQTPVQTAFQTLSIAKGASASGTMELTFPGVKVVSGESYVVFEKLYKTSDFDQAARKPSNPKATVAEHADPKDGAQTVYVPGVTTDAKDGDGDKYVDPTQPIKIVDTVTGSGLIPGKEYTIDGELMMAGQNGEPVHTGVFNNGGDVKVVADANGKFQKDLTFEMSVEKAKELGLWVDENGQPTPTGKDLVVFENLKQGGKPVAIHHDITDEAQTVHSGSMGTSAKDSDGNQTMIPGQENAVITDTVKFTGKFEPKHNYTLVGELHYVTTNPDGSKTDAGKVPGVIVQPVQVTSDAKGIIGKQTMKFTVAAKSIVEGKDLVVFETLHDGTATGKVVVKHANPNDPAQTINVVKNSITTTAYDGGKDGKGADPKDKNLDNSHAKVAIYDLVDYEGLQVGKEYTVTGTLHYQADATLADGTQVHTGDPIDAKYVTVTPAKFTAKTPSSKDQGAVKAIVKFEVDKAALATAPVVVFEDLQDGTVTVATHHDINDDSQVVYNPSLATVATVNDGKLVQLKKDQKAVTVDDEVTITNAAPGTYTLKGELMSADGKTVISTSEVKNVKVTKGEATVQKVTFQVPANQVKAGAKFVVFEELVDAKGVVVADHKDLASEAQTVRVGSLETTATDKADGDHVADNTKTVTIVDKVDYSGLNLDAKYADGTPQAYLLSGQLMDKQTKQTVPGLAPVERVIGPAGSVYRAEGQPDRPVEKVITSGTGFELLEFEVPANLILGKPVVVFETVYQDGKEYLIHHDINDDSQTVWSPKLATKASVENERGLVIADAKSTVKDTVTFTGMKVGETYVVAGELWNKTQNKSTGIKVTSKPFKADKASWTATDFMTFEVPAGTVAENDELVVFETLYRGDKVTNNPASTHKDPNDPAQTVGSGVKPAIKTVLSTDGNRVAGADIPTIPVDTTQLVDTVSYVGLTPGVKYTLNATLMEIGLDGKVSDTGITGTATFTPTAANGTQKVGYNSFDKGILKPGYKYVAYETLIRNDKPNEPPLKHEDPKDSDQTVKTDYHPSVVTDLTQDGSQVIATDAALDLQDKVQMKGLVKGEKYVLVSRLVYNAGQPNETVVTDGLEKFTADSVNMTKVIKFNVTTDQLKAPMVAAKAAGSELKLVAYEYLTRASLVTGDDTTIKASVTDASKWDATHAQANDTRQTVTVVDVPRIGTKLQYAQGQKVVWEGDNVKLTDFVEYYNLLPATEYTLNGKLMGIAADGKVSDTGVVGTAKFTTPKATNGATRVSGTIADKTAAKVEFTVPLSVLKANDKLVAYEALLLKGQPVADHEDPNDENQTVKVKHPGVGTIAHVGDDTNLEVWEGVNQEGKKAPDTYTVHDVIRMVNVEEGKTYALGGQVYSKIAYDANAQTPALAANAKTVKVTADMAKPATDAEKAQYGADVKVYETSMDIPVKAADIKTHGDKLVVFEQLWAEGTYESADGGKVTPKGNHKPVAAHNEITADSQSINVNRPEFGSLTLTKAVTGWDENTANVERAKATYVFTVKCAQKGSVDTITLHEGGSHTIDGIPVGDKCTITEDVQHAELQAGLKDTVKFTETNGVTVESVKNGEGTVMVGGTSNGTDRVPNVTVVADNKFTNEVTIGTNTTGQFGKKSSNGDKITDLVKYQNLQAGKYLLHTYFVEYDKAGQAHKIDYVPSEVREVTVEGGYVPGGHSGTWSVDMTVPTELTQAHKTVVVWEDLYKLPQNVDTFTTELSKLPTGRTGAGLIASHHEDNLGAGAGTQWLEVSTHFGGFQVNKVVKPAPDLPADVISKIPATWNFTYVAKLPDGKKAKEGTALQGNFNLTVDPKDPSKAVSQKFDGFPMGTEITITETDAKAQIPTQAKLKVSWKSEGWTDAAEGPTKTFTITPAATVSVTALNEFSLVKPTLATVARTADDGKMLKPSEDTAVVDTVTYTNLVQGRDYWLKTELVYVDGTPDPNDNQPVLGADGNPLVKWTKVTAEGDNSEWVVDKDNPMVVPANANANADVVFFESLYEMTRDGGQPKVGDKPIAEHRDNADPKQIITRRPALSLQTTAELSGAKSITAGEGVTVNDKVTYSGLKAGADYTLVGTLVKKSDGSIVGSPVTAAGLKAEADGSGSWKMSIPLTPQDTAGLTDGEKLVVFEKAYAGKLPEAGTAAPGVYTPVLTHEDLEDASQTVNVVKPSTPPPYTPGTPGTPPVESKTTTPPPPPVKSETTKPPSTTPSTPPDTPPSIPVAPATTVPPMHPKVPPTLARTGAQAAIFGGLSILMIAAGAGLGLLAARRKRESEAK